MSITEVLIVFGLSTLAFWRREFILYFIAFFGIFFIGVRGFDSSIPLGVSITLLGTYLFFKGIKQIITGGARF